MKFFCKKKFAVIAALLSVSAACFACACTLAAVVDAPQVQYAFAAEEDVSEAESTQATTEESTDAEKGTDTEVLVSAEGDAAKIDGAAFALTNFSRAQVGSNRNINDVYAGYAYYAGASSEKLCIIATNNYVVAYVPKSVQEEFSISLSSEESQDTLKQILVALDAEAAAGSAELDANAQWFFTDEETFTYNNLVFSFMQELKTNQYYVCVLGSDGSDITQPSNPNYTRLQFADFASVDLASNVEIQGKATGLAALGEFLATVDLSPLWVTLKTTLTAIVFIFILGLAAAYFSLRIPSRAQDIADAIFTIPMVLPPTVCGFLLLMLFGNNSPIGKWFIDIGCPLIFSWPATVIAAVVVAFPLMYRNARGAFEGLDSNMLDAARTLGWSNSKVFFKLMLPLSWSSIAAGTVLSFARALGEFGATLFLAGNFLGVTRTIPIAIYFEWMNGNIEVTWFWIIVILIFSFIVILFINLWSRRTTRYRRKAVE